MHSYTHLTETEAIGPRGPQRLDSLTGMRFAAALLVFFFHASLTKIIGFNPYADPTIVSWFQKIFSVAGWIGVSFFFVLSGFVITWSARSDDTVLSFWRRRIVKIYPNHLVTWIAGMLIFTGPVVATSAAIPNLLLIHAWIPDINVFLSVNGPSWSLCCELLFYLLFPLMLRWLDSVPDNKLWTAAALLVASLAACQIAIDLVVPGQPHIAEYPISMQQWWLSYFFPPFRMFEFALGMVMARLLRSGQWPAMGLATACAFMLFGYIGSMFVPFLYSMNLATIVPIACLITAFADADVRGKASLFSSKVLVRLGEISFAFYMVHLLVMTVATRLIGGRLYEAPAATAIVVVVLIVSLCAGWLMYLFVEKPIVRRWGGKALTKSFLRPARS